MNTTFSTAGSFISRIIQICVGIIISIPFLPFFLLYFVLVLAVSIYTTTTWYIKSKKSKRTTYRNWLRKELNHELAELRGKNPLILCISGPSGFDWQGAQYLKPGEKQNFNWYRVVPIGSEDWRGYVRKHMYSARQKFKQQEIFPAIEIFYLLIAIYNW